MRALGLMSGTSLDGVDAAIVETDGEERVRLGPCLTIPYDDALRRRLRAVLGDAAAARGVEHELTDAHAEAVRQLLDAHGLAAADIDVIGFHGQTVLHRPEQRRTWQIGDGARLAKCTGIRVVNDFRTADVSAGGQGAPLVPVYHRALAAELPKPLAVVNIGGVANVTWIGGDGALLAFDTGPGNALIDDWTLQHTGQRLDADGGLAGIGRVNAVLLDQLMAHAFFDQPPPKSLDRNDFSHASVAGLSASDGARTLTAFTAYAIARAQAHFPSPPTQWLICGGGRHNPVLMAELAGAVAEPVQPVEAVGWRGDSLEAEAFAYLAVRVLKGLPTSFPSTTGAPRPICGGRAHAA
jgi:anhydro-N-acetylmuramic acid kinase